jgi:predicted O-linked N-acetylglucosamine transferase (SPINDLY family)
LNQECALDIWSPATNRHSLLPGDTPGKGIALDKTDLNSNVEALFRQASACLRAGQFAEAERHYKELLCLQPNHLGALNLLGILLIQTGRYDEAERALRAAIDADPRSEATHYNHGVVLRKLNRLAEALIAFDRALALNSAVPDTWNNRGTVLNDLQRFDAALSDFNKAIALKPDFADAFYNQGNSLNKLGRHEAAVVSYDKAIALEPNIAAALNNRGNALLDLKRFDEAIASYDRALAITSNLRNARGMRLIAKMHLCDWRDFDSECSHVISTVKSGNLASIPFAILPISSSAEDQLNCARLYVAAQSAPAAPLWRGECYGHDRIRVGYLSSDMRDHAVGFLIAGLFEQHNRSRFETVAFSLGFDDNSATRRRIEQAFDQFHDVRQRTDQEIAELIRHLEIDIAVDLNGLTQGARTNALARRPAPIQANYLGYPGTMGADFIDYIIADRFIIPPDQYRFYSEKVVYLPDTYQVNDDKRQISNVSPSRAQVGLPTDGFVFCSFNNSFKITPFVFDAWMRLLRQIEGSVLWLLEGDARVPVNLRMEAEQRGVTTDRLVFAPRMQLEDHLARHRLADLFLDTLPYNAHTTASDALWAGLPVLTCVGSTFAGRVAASLLNAIGLPELITNSLDDYETLALGLAPQPGCARRPQN